MQKAKLGISVGLLGAGIYFMGLFGGYIVSAILVGYVLLFEQNEWLRKSAVKSIALMFGFSIVTALLNLIPNAISFINSIFSIFGGNFSISAVSGIISALIIAINVIEKLLFLGMGVNALNQGTFSIPILDKLISKHME